MRSSSPRPVVVGVDGSDAALAAARVALAEARRRSAPLLVVTVVRWPYDGLTTPPPGIDLPALLRESGQAVVQRALGVLDDSAGVDVSLKMVGSPRAAYAASHAPILSASGSADEYSG